MVEYNKDLLDKYEALVNDFDECLQESVLFSKAEKERLTKLSVQLDKIISELWIK